MIDETPNHSRTIVVDGASGYVGTHLIASLVAAGHKVRALIHPFARSKDKAFLQALQAEVVTCSMDVRDEGLLKALEGADACVHLIGSIAPRKGESFEDLHVSQTESLINAARQKQVPKIIMVTALGTRADSPSNYHRTKWLAEEKIRNSGIKYFILRPSLIIGRTIGYRDSKLVTRYRDMILSRRPVVPLLNDGQNKIQPIFIDDLIAVITKCVISQSMESGTFEVAGPQTITMKEFVAMLMEHLNIRKSTINLPPALAFPIASILENFQKVPLLSQDQIHLAKLDNICDHNAIKTVFGITPRDIATALSTYSQNKEPTSMPLKPTGRSVTSDQ